MSSVKVIDLKGNARKRGEAHGEELREKIVIGIEYLRKEIGELGAGSFEEVISEFLSKTDFLSPASRWAPNFLQEIEGIAGAAGFPSNTLFAFNCLDEWCWYKAARYRSPTVDSGCSAVAIRDRRNGQILAAQTHDLWESFAETLAVLRVADEETGTSAIVLTAAGMIGLSGCSNRVISMNCNSLVHSLPHSSSGLPVAFILRKALSLDSIDEIRAFLSGIRHASGQNYMVCSASEIMDFECSSDGCIQVHCADNVMLHTNHVLSGGHLAKKRGSENSYERLTALKSRVNSDSGSSAVKACLGAGPVFDRQPDHYTAAAVMFQMKVPPRVEVTFNPSSPDGWLEVGFLS